MRARDFPDPGLRLGILDVLLGHGHLDEDDLRTRLEIIPDPDVAITRECEEEWIADALARLGMVELDPAHLCEIVRLDFHVANEIYTLIEESLGIDTRGKTEQYRVRSLVGIQWLTALEVLDLDGHVDREAPLDLSPLWGHPALQIVRLSGLCTATETLEHLPALVEVEDGRGVLDDLGVGQRLAREGIFIYRKSQL
jgi:hypothetical protein